jgi:glycosyltransferase involved in cell wall biosynthesis
LIKKKPDFFVSHLLTSIPFIIFYILRIKTKLILRISGFPKLTILRKILWKFCSKKIFKVTFPSIELLNQFSKLDIFLREQLIFLPDPIINLREYLIKKESSKNNLKNPTNKNFFMSAGRLTRQKNFSYLITEFKKFSDINTKFDLLIFGTGEEKEKLRRLIQKLDLSERVYLMGYTEYIYEYMRRSDAFVLSSLWEDPGHVIVEAAFNNSFVISSNCKNGPSEFLEYGRAGILFENNIKNSLFNALEIFVSRDFDKRSKKFLAKKNCLKYSLLRHNNIIKNIFLN